MVGVAGRSKGCATCRRRKIKCDLGKPACEACQKSRRFCEGYDRYPVFLIRTTEGLQKRVPLEEMKPLSLPTRDGGERPKAQPPDAMPKEAVAQQPPTQALTTRTNAIAALEITPNSFHSGTAEAIRFVSSTYELYIDSPDGRNRYPHIPIRNFYHAILSHGSSDDALDLAMLAMAACGSGMAYGDRQMLEKSRVIYGRALQALQRALYSPDMAIKDETFAVSCLMALYEWSNPQQDWLSHIGGICTLMLTRSAKRLRGNLALRAFESCRYNLMLYCILNRKALEFNTDVWMHEPWSNYDKGLEQQIMDHGFVYAAVLERLDDVVRDLTFEEVQKAVRRCMLSVRALHHLSVMLDERSSQLDASEDEDDLYQDTNRILLQITAMMLELGLSVSARAMLARAVCPIVPRIQKPIGIHVTSLNQQLSLARGIVQKAGVALARRVVAADRLLLPLELAAKVLRQDHYLESQEALELRRQLLGHAARV